MSGNGKWTEIPSGIRDAASQRFWVALGDHAYEVAVRINAHPEFVASLATFCTAPALPAVVQTIEELKPLILTYVGTIDVPAIAGRVTTSKFFTRTELAHRGIKVSSISSLFSDKFRGGSIEVSQRHTLRVNKLAQTSNRASIITFIGDEKKAESTLIDVLFMLTRQGDGRDGFLLTNDDPNIFFVRNDAGDLIDVVLRWTDDGWWITAGNMNSVRDWSRGRVFYPVQVAA